MDNERAVTVSELTDAIKNTLEDGFDRVTAVGELSNYKDHRSGHWYFSLKDSDAQISCAMWKWFNQYCFFTPEEGMNVLVRGKLSVYPPRGTYQIDVRHMKPAAGEGELNAAFERLKKKLAAEGLFDEERKKPLPIMPETIGVAASADGAALQDILSVARRRFPLMTVKTAPCRAQGPGAAESVAKAVRRLDAEPDVEAIIVARGGGSIEDLWAFNEETLARAIAEAGTPVVSGVGHEIDFTIADFVADYRAATPTAAMEALTIDRRELRANIKAVVGAAGETLLDRVEDERAALKTTLVSRAFRVSEDLLAEGSQRLDRAAYRIQLGAERKAERARNRLELFTSKIMVADPNAPLKRGFVLAEQDGKLIGRASNFSRAKDVLLKFYDGEISLKRES